MGGGGNMGGGGAPPPPMTTIVWDSAAPVHEARVKLEQKDWAELRAKDFYVVSIVGFPMRGQQPNAEQMRKRLASAAILERKGKDPIAAADVGFVKSGEKLTVVFLFPRTTAIETTDKEVTFQFKGGPMEAKAKFPLKDMMYGGKLAL